MIAPSLHHHPEALLRGLLAQQKPALFIEHKLLYPKHVEPIEATRAASKAPTRPASIGSTCLG